MQRIGSRIRKASDLSIVLQIAESQWSKIFVIPKKMFSYREFYTQPIYQQWNKDIFRDIQSHKYAAYKLSQDTIEGCDSY